MILSLIIIVVLLLGFYAGYRRGFIRELVYLAGYGLTFFVAIHYYKSLADDLELWIPYPTPALDTTLNFYSQKLLLTLNQSFYAAIAFVLILLVGWLLVRFIGALCHKLTYVGGHIGFFRIANGLIGGTIHTVIVYIFMTLMLVLASLLPIASVQDTLYESTIASAMIQDSPIISDTLNTLWIEDIQK